MGITRGLEAEMAARVVERVREWEKDLERAEKERRWLARPRFERVGMRLVWGTAWLAGSTAICTALFLLFPGPGESFAKLTMRILLSFGVFVGVVAGLGQLWDAIREPKTSRRAA